MKYPQLVSMPSAVSDWLEEQLEARGIDSGVYTRYILSLLHAHTLDVIYPEEDLPFSSQLKKDGGRGAASYKRIRRTGPWWKHADADAEQIKRSAAVECLMSAAEQNCEIESLVDELCEKLKEVNSEAENSSNETNQDTNSDKDRYKLRKISPKELAEQYYEAFPPLNKEDNYLNANIHLVVGKWPSPEKSLNNIDVITAKWTSSGSPKRTKRKPKRQPHGTMKSSTRTSHNRSRVEYKRVHCVRTCSREMADNRANWEIVNNNNNNYEMADQCLDSSLVEIDPAASEMYNICDIFHQWRKDIRKDIRRTTEGYRRRQSAQSFPIPSTKLGKENLKCVPDSSKRNEASRRFNRQVQLLSPYGEETAIPEQYQRRRFEEDPESAIKEEYERPSAQDVLLCVDGRWTNKPDHFPDLIPVTNDLQLLSRFLGPRAGEYGRPIAQDDPIEVNGQWNGKESQEFAINLFMGPKTVNTNFPEATSGRHTPPVFRRLRAGGSVTPDVISELLSENESLFDETTRSLLKINHNKDTSAFQQYVRPTAFSNALLLPRPGPFSRPFGPRRKPPPLPAHVIPKPEEPSGDQNFFKPIRTPPLESEHREEPGRQYEDGATFCIRSDLNRVQYKRNKTGQLYVQTDFGENYEYLEYNWRRPSDESMILSPRFGQPTREEFKPKFRVSQNDKASQTESYIGLLAVARNVGEVVETVPQVPEFMDFGRALAFLENEILELQSETEANRLDERRFTNPQEVTIWRESDSEECDADPRCTYSKKVHQLDTKALWAIWGRVGLVSRDCPQHEEAEWLLPEIDNVPDASGDLLQNTNSGDLSQNTNTSLETVVASAERKRRHSHANNDAETWSFASGLMENCLISLPPQPLRRSVTL